MTTKRARPARWPASGLAALAALWLLCPGLARADETPGATAAVSGAQTPAAPAPDPFAMSLKDLLQQQVVTSSTKTPQTESEAPAIVTVVSREEILRMGYLDLGEVLRNVVGFGMNDNGHWPDTGVRGINDRTTYGDKIQMLVDGHNMAWRQFNRNYHNPTWAAMEDIKRIEIIRGPGSAVWGANALNGVVNIVTRDWADLDGVELTLGGDHRFDSQMISARMGKNLSQDFGIYASVSYYFDDADSLLSPIREFQKLDGTRYQVVDDEEQGINATVKARWKWFRASFTKLHHDTGAPLSTFSVVGGDDSRFVTDRHIVRLSFSKMLRSDLELSAEGSFDDYAFVDGTAYEDNARASTVSDPALGGPGRFLRKMRAIDRRYELELQAVYRPLAELEAVAGVELEYLDLVRWYFPEVWRANGLATPTFTNLRVGGFLQAQYSPLSWLGVTAGARVDYDENYDVVATPRAGLVFRLPAGFYVKGLFGTAYKAPSYHDLYYFRKNAFYGNPSLDPETSITGEGMLGYRHPAGVDIRLTGFYTRIDNLITYVKRTAGESLQDEGGFPDSQRPDGSTDYSQKQNREHVTTKGVEAEMRFLPWDRLVVALHGTYRRPTDSNGDRLYYSSEWTAGGSVSLRVSRGLRVTVRGLAVGDKQVPARGLNEPGFTRWDAADDPTLEAPAHFLGTVMINAKDVLHEGLSLHLKLDNIANTEAWDAGRELLYPRRKFQGMVWATLAL